MSLLIVSLLAWADLYTIEQPIKGAGTQLSDSDIDEALKTLLVKLSGDKEVRFNPEIDRQVRVQAKRNILSQYQVIEIEGVLLHKMTFNATLVERLLNSLNIKIWRAPRPTTLIWVALEDLRKNRVILNEQSKVYNLQNLIKQLKNERGIEFLFPLLSLEERLNVKPSQFWSHNDDNIIETAKTYQSNQVAVIAIRKQVVNFKLDWRLYTNQGSLVASGEATDISVVSGIEKLMHHITNATWEKEYQQLEKERIFQVVIQPVSSWQEFNQIDRQIRRGRWVKNVFLQYAGEGSLRYEMIAAGNGSEYINEMLVTGLFEWENAQESKLDLQSDFFDTIPIVFLRVKH